MKKWASWLWLPAFFLSLLFAVQLAQRLGFFIDETVDNSAAAYHFFRTGIYSAVRFAKPFDVEITSGLPVTWISGLVWMLGGSLFIQRVLLLAWHLLLAFWLVNVAQVVPRVRATAILWMFFLLVVPNWQTLLQNLAEVEGAILFALALLYATRQPLVAGALLGTAVWGCKIIILPGALLLLAFVPAGQVFFNQRRAGEAITLLAKFCAGFLLPLFIWMAYIALRSGGQLAWEWPYRLFYFVTHQGGAGLAQERLSLSERLGSPQLEWVTYNAGMKVRILFLLALPAFYLLAGFISRSARDGFRSLVSQITGMPYQAVLGLYLAFNLFYGVWWFFFHPVMIYRHIQFALVASFLVGSVFAFAWVRGFRGARYFLPMAGLFFCAYFLKLNFQTFQGTEPRPFYSSLCRTRLLTRQCLTETYWSLVPPADRQPE